MTLTTEVKACHHRNKLHFKYFHNITVTVVFFFYQINAALVSIRKIRKHFNNLNNSRLSTGSVCVTKDHQLDSNTAEGFIHSFRFKCLSPYFHERHYSVTPTWMQDG